MSFNIKKVFKVYSVVEYKNIGNYLSEMARKGWLLTGIKNLLYNFEKVEPIELDFNVVILSEKDAFDYHDPDSDNTLKEFCTDSGWTYCTGTPAFQIFYKKKESTVVPIHTDESEEYKYIKKTFIKTELFISFLMLLSIFQFISGIKYFDYETIFSNAELISIILPLIMMLIVINVLYIPIVWLIRNKTNLDNNRPLTHFSDAFVKRKYRFYFILMGLYLVLLVVSFSDSFSRAGVIVLPMLLVFILPMIAAVVMIKRFKKVKKSRRRNILMYVGVSILVMVVSLSAVTLYITSRPHNEFEDVVSDETVLEFSDFGDYLVKANHMRKKGSIFTPVYLEYYESIRDGNLDIGYIDTTYIECSSDKVVDYVVKNMLIDNERYMSNSGYVSLSNETWSIDQGYYLSDNRSMVLLVKDNRILTIRSDMDFEDTRIIEICKTKLELN